MKKSKMTKSQAGKEGANVTHKKRYEILLELSKLVDKEYQNFLIKWPTSHLERLLNAYNQTKSR